MRPITVTVDLPVPPDEAFDYVADPENDPEWCKAVFWCRLEAGPPVSRGARYGFEEGTNKDKPGEKGSVTILEIDPPRAITYRAENDKRRYRIEYRFEAVQGGTRLTQTTWPSFKGWFDRVGWVTRPLILMQYKRQFRDLARVMDERKGI